MSTEFQIFNNPLTTARDHRDLIRLRTHFPDLAECTNHPYLALRPYLDHCPERFYNKKVYKIILHWLKNRETIQRKELISYLSKMDAELSRAILNIRIINAEKWHDHSIIKDDNYGVHRFIDKELHPTYLRLVEGVLTPFLKGFALFMRIDRKKGTEGLDIHNIADELKNTPLNICVDAYNATVRNGIGHGDITYFQNEIKYKDKRGREEVLSIEMIIRLYDDMVDICNAISAAMKTFLFISTDKGYRLPHELLVEELVEGTKTPYWNIEGCLTSKVLNYTQLLIYARPNSRDTQKINYSTIQTAVFAEALAPGYGRYFISLHSSKALPGWAIFDGDRLKQARESGATDLRDIVGALEKPGIFFIAKHSLPRWVSRFNTLYQSFCIHWPAIVYEFRSRLQIPDIIIREARIHRNGWRSVLIGIAVIKGCEKEKLSTIIRQNKRKIIRLTLNEGRGNMPLLKSCTFLPLGYAKLSIYSEDFRVRRLANFGLNPELICTIRYKRIKRINEPDLWESTVESEGNWRIAWNKSWINSFDEFIQ